MLVMNVFNKTFLQLFRIEFYVVDLIMFKIDKVRSRVGLKHFSVPEEGFVVNIRIQDAMDIDLNVTNKTRHSNGGYVKDFSAFIFSLENKEENPFKVFFSNGCQ